MRGRTNIPPRQEPVINGQTRNFVVESGNTIAKGDFVSYVLNKSYANFDSRDITLVYKNEYDETNHKFVLVYKVKNGNPIAMLVQIINGDITVLNTVSLSITNSLLNAYMDGTSLYIVDSPETVTSLSVNILTSRYDITNNALVFNQTYTNSIYAEQSNTTIYPTNVAVKGTTIFLTYAEYYAPSSSKVLYLKVRIGTLGGSMGSTIVELKRYSVTSSAHTKESASYTVGNNVVIIASLNEFTAITTFSTTAQIDVETFDFHLICADRFGSKFAIFTHTVNTSNTTYTRFVDCDNSGNLSVLFGELLASTNYKGYLFHGRVGQNRYAAMVYSKSGSVVTVTTKTYTIGSTITYVTNTDNVVIDPESTSLQCILSDYTTNVLLEKGSVLSGVNSVVKYYGSDVEIGFIIGQPSSYVRSYAGGYTVGFAATGGTAGQTIAVYTPYDV